MYYCYVVYCSDKTLYTGYTDDIARRVAVHNSGKGAKYTMPRRPVRLLFSKGFEGKREALSYEAGLKKRPRTAKLREIIENGQCVIRPARQQELQEVVDILRTGKQALCEAGVDQWQGDYPDVDVVSEDITLGQCYVICFCEVIVGTFVFTTLPDPSYEGSEVFEKLSQYGSLHRIAVLPDFKGLGIARRAVRFCVGECNRLQLDTLRCDTHEQNASMRRMLTKSGFNELGHIILVSGEPRIAFEQKLEW